MWKTESKTFYNERQVCRHAILDALFKFCSDYRTDVDKPDVDKWFRRSAYRSTISAEAAPETALAIG